MANSCQFWALSRLSISVPDSAMLFAARARGVLQPLLAVFLHQALEA